MAKHTGTRNYVIVMDVGYGPFIWQNMVMYYDSAEKAYHRIRAQYPGNKSIRLCSLYNMYSEV